LLFAIRFVREFSSGLFRFVPVLSFGKGRKIMKLSRSLLWQLDRHTLAILILIHQPPAMNFEEEQLIEVAEELIRSVRDNGLTDTEVEILRGSYQGKGYSEISEKLEYRGDGLKKDIGPKLWKFLSEALNEKISKKRFKEPLRRYWEQSVKNSQPPQEENEKNIEPILLKLERSLPPDNLPTRNYTNLIGRETELTQLRELLSPSNRKSRIVVGGIGGIGKTSLVLEAAYSCLEEDEASSRQIIIFTTAQQTRLTGRGIEKSLQREATLEDIFRAIARTLDCRELLADSPDFQTRLQNILDSLRRQPVVLILDNLDTLEDIENVRGFIYNLPHQVKVVITSREKVQLEAATPIRLEPLGEADGISLIRHLAENSVSLTEEQCRQVWEKTSGIPAAMVYIIGQLAADYPLEPVLERLTRASGDVVRYCFEGSVAFLQEREPSSYRLLMALARFPGGSGPEAIALVAGVDFQTAIDGGLAKLRQQYLAVGEPSRYQMLSLTREYAIAYLQNHPELEREIIESWLSWSLDYCQEHGGKDWQEWNEYDELEREWENIKEALFYCIDNNRYEDVCKFWHTVKCYNYSQGYYRGDRSNYWKNTRLFWTEWLIEAAKEREDWFTAAEIMGDRAWTFTLINRPESLAKADLLFQDAWNICQQHDLDLKLHLAIYIGALRVYQTRFEEATSWLNEAEELWEKADLEAEEKTKKLIHICYYRGHICYKTDVDDLGKKLFAEVLKLAKEINWERAVYLAKDWLADIDIKQGNFEEAEKLLLEGLEVAKINKDKCREAFCQRSLARLEKGRGNVEAAISFAREARDNFRSLGMRKEEGETEELLEQLS
jgi:LuxR family glucitol operon transcriptional activator